MHHQVYDCLTINRLEQRQPHTHDKHQQTPVTCVQGAVGMERRALRDKQAGAADVVDQVDEVNALPIMRHVVVNNAVKPGTWHGGWTCGAMRTWW